MYNFSIKFNNCQNIYLERVQQNKMSSPPRYRKTFSPIRGIDERYSPSRDLDVILEESVSSKKSVYDDVGN